MASKAGTHGPLSITHQPPGMPVDTMVASQSSENTSHDSSNLKQTQQICSIEDNRPENYIGWSVVSCLCCCWIFGIIALIYSIEVNYYWKKGKRRAAKHSSILAKHSNVVSFMFGIGFLILAPVGAGLAYGLTTIIAYLVFLITGQ